MAYLLTIENISLINLFLHNVAKQTLHKINFYFKMTNLFSIEISFINKFCITFQNKLNIKIIFNPK